MLLPAGLPGYEVRVASDTFDDVGASTVMACSVLQLDLRLHDYFMGKSAPDDASQPFNSATDASLNLSAIKGSVLDACSEHNFFAQGHQRYQDSFLIDGTVDSVCSQQPLLMFDFKV